MRINKHDTNGVKPLLGKGELGYDDYTAGGDAGRVYVGTGTENIALAEKLEANIMTKAQFNALAEERKANRAGSGFDELGKHYITVGTYPNINTGIFTNNTYTNYFRLGIQSGIGESRTDEAVLCTNGVKQRLSYLSQSAMGVSIVLPTAPTIYPSTITLTAEQIASGVITHADASNSGLIVNGKFDTDTSGWTSSNSTLSIDAGRLKVTNTTTGNGFAYQSQTFIIGKKYIIEFQQQYGNIQGAVRVGTTNIGGEIFNEYSADTTGTATNGKIEFIATATTLYITLVTSAGSIGDYRFFDNIAVYPADAISRSDLVFLESWHEDISEKNFIYPLGNVQYLGSNTDGLTGIANGTFTGFETYSLFGNWQSSSALIGKGYVWSTLTEVQKKAFVANPENNCYLDGDKVIQVRYRIRIVQGVSDSINSFSKSNSSSYLALNESGVGSSFLINAKGKQTSIAETKDYASRVTTGTYGYQGSNTTLGVDTVSGDLVSVTTFGTPTNVAYEGKCYALPIALVHRRNQGAYHPVYNPNGSSMFWDTPHTGSINWYGSSTYIANNISQCFVFGQTGTTANCVVGGTGLYYGSIASTYSGRPDGLFYDQVHESDILDLRNSSKKVEDYNRLINREFNKLVAGTYRGKEGEKKTDIFVATPTKIAYSTYHTSYYITIPNTTNTDKFVLLYGGKLYRLTYITYDSGNSFGCLIDDIESLPNIPLVEYVFFKVDSFDETITNICRKPYSTTTRTKSNTLLHCDIIGNPANYPTAWKQSGVSGTPLIVAEDGTSLLPTGSLTAFKVSRKANATPLLVLKSTDSGTTWSALTVTTHYTFNTTTNAITMVTAPATTDLIMVYYQTHTNMAIPVVNSEVLGIGDVWASSDAYNNVSQIVGKVTVGNSQPYHTAEKLTFSLEHKGINPSNAGKLVSYNSGVIPRHDAISIYGASGVPAVKLFPYLTRTNGKAFLNLVFKEMKHNGTTWGDHDNTFNIVDNVSTTTDGNGQTILIGQKTVELPYFIGGDE